jgi:hypothetical protein
MTKKWWDSFKMKNGVLRDSSGMTNETRAHLFCHAGSVSHNTFRSSFFTTFVTLEASLTLSEWQWECWDSFRMTKEWWDSFRMPNESVRLFQNDKEMVRFFQNEKRSVERFLRNDKGMVRDSSGMTKEWWDSFRTTNETRAHLFCRAGSVQAQYFSYSIYP